MNGMYRKEGSTARVTSLRGEVFESTTRESGVAGYSGGRFFSASGEPRDALPVCSIDDARALHDAMVSAVGKRARVERLRAVCGSSAHRFEPEDEDERIWSETLAIVHLTLVARSGARLSLLRGGPSPAAIDRAELAAVAAALAGARERRRVDPERPLLLSPAPAAAVAAELARDPRAAAELPLAQEGNPDFPFDGEGRPVAKLAAAGWTTTASPNVFRPSYRSPAVAALMHVELATRSAVREMAGAVEVVELLRPPHLDRGALLLDAVCAEDGQPFFGTLQIGIGRLAAAAAAGERRVWHPFHAGAWGRPTIVPPARRAT